MRKKLTLNQIEQVLENAKSSLAVESMEVTESETKVVRKYLQGGYSEKDVLKIIKSK